MVSKEQIESILNHIINDPTETDKCGSGNSGSGGGKKNPKKKPSKKKPKTPKQIFEEFDAKKFAKEEYTNEAYAHPDKIDLDWESPQGRLQGIQSDAQWDTDYTFEEESVAYEWSTSLFIPLNSYLFNKPDLFGEMHYGDEVYNGDKLSDLSNRLSGVIDKSPRAKEDFVSYRWGPVDDLLGMEVGEGGTFKGFQSTSFNYSVAQKSLQEQVGGWFKNNRGMVRYHNMKGSKGMVIDNSVRCKDWQSEWLLDKGQKFVLVGKGLVDYNGEKIMTYDVVVYD